MRFIFSYWCYHSPSFICRLSESLVLPNQTWILSTFWRSCHVPYSHGYSSLLPSSSRSKQNVSKEKTAMKQMWKNKNKKRDLNHFHTNVHWIWSTSQKVTRKCLPKKSSKAVAGQVRRKGKKKMPVKCEDIKIISQLRESNQRKKHPPQSMCCVCVCLYPPQLGWMRFFFTCLSHMCGCASL
jgi:hypothetical protein